MYDTYPHVFAALPPELNNLESAKVVILPIPFDVTSTFQKGSHRGPAAIIEASRQMELWDEELGQDTSLIGIHTADEPYFHDLRPELMVEAVQEMVGGFLEQGKFVVTLGGEHSITTGPVRAHAARFKNLSVVQIDAHADLRDSYQGTPYNHACVMRRLIDDHPCVQLGIRNWSEEEDALIRERNLPVFTAERCMADDSWHEEALAPLTDQVYLTIDLDGFDPSIMPSTGTPEPGGLTWYPVIRFLRKLIAEKRLVGFDIMEMMPIGGLVAPQFMAAKLLYKILGYTFKDEVPGA